MTFKKDAIKNQLELQDIQFQNTDRFLLMASILKKFTQCQMVVDAGGGEGTLGRFFGSGCYINWDLLDSHDIEDHIPSGDVVVFSHVLEHVLT